MNKKEFDYFSQVSGSKQSDATKAAYHVLVCDWTQSDAARAFSIHRSAVHHAVKRIQSAAIACPCCGRAF